MRQFFSIFILTLLFFPAALLLHSRFTPEPRPQDHGPLILMNTLDIWNEKSPAHYGFSPVQTHSHPGDKGVTDYKRLTDAEGDNFYISHPPFAFVFSWGMLRLSGQSASYPLLQWCSLILLLLSSFFLATLVSAYMHSKTNPEKKFRFRIHLPSVTAFLVYSMMPVILYLHAFNYFAELWGQFFWILLIALVFLFQLGPDRRLLPALSAAAFFLVYSDWSGLLVILALFAAFFNRRKEAKIKKLLVFTGTGSIAALALSVIQYASLAGLSPFLRSLFIRYSERSGLFGDGYSADGMHLFNTEGLAAFVRNLHQAMLPFGYLALFLGLLVWLLTRRSGKPFRLSSDFRVLLILTALPVLLKFILLFNASATHRLYMSGLAVPVAFLAGAAVFHLQTARVYRRSLLLLLGILLLFVSWQAADLFRNHYAREYACSDMKLVAQKIRDEALPEEAVFICNESSCPLPLPYLTWASGRNPASACDTLLAARKTLELKKEKAVFFVLRKDSVPRVYHLFPRP